MEEITTTPSVVAPETADDDKFAPMQISSPSPEPPAEDKEQDQEQEQEHVAAAAMPPFAKEQTSDSTYTPAPAPAPSAAPVVPPEPFDVHEFVSGLVPAGDFQRVVYYENPVHSAIAIGTWLLPFAALTLDFGFSPVSAPTPLLSPLL